MRIRETRRPIRVWPLVVVLAGAASCAEAPPPLPPLQPVSTVQELMQGVFDPAADVLWGSVGTIITVDGVEERYPRSDEEWDAVWHSTVQLTEAGNLLMLGERARDQGDWMTLAQEMIQAGIEAQRAARSHDPDAVLAVGEQVYNVCTRCHQQYWPDNPGRPE